MSRIILNSAFAIAHQIFSHTMAPTLYMIDASPPVRAVLMTAKAIGLDLNKKELDLFRREHLKHEFLKLNPQHTVPTLVDDDGTTIWDSHAIMAYLVSKYAKNDALYPEDSKKRAVVNQRLHFDSSVAFVHMRNIAKAVLFYFENSVPEEEREGVLQAYDFLESFLDGKDWICGNVLSIADYSLIATVSTLDTVVPIDFEKYPNVVSWVDRCEMLPEYKVNRKGLREAAEMFRARLK